ncbi:MAG: apolipoprotein N-acyltransferase [Bacteroidia bacterium]|nr:apolipoprotein N-acyltransferase [Bacteroidia bacterium]
MRIIPRTLPVEKWYSSWLALPTQYPYRAAFAAGALLGLSFPPFSFPWLIWPAWSLLWSLAQLPSAFRPLYVALLTWNSIGCYWLTLTALSAPNGTEAIVSFLAGALAIGINPLLMLLPFLLWRWLSRRSRVGFSPWLFIPFWGAFEYGHFRWELTWSWLTLGFAWSEWSFWAQLSAWFGPLGLSIWTLVGAAILFVPRPWLHKGTLFLGWIAGLPLLVSFFSSYKVERTNPPLTVWILQPNIDPYAKFSELPPEEQVRRVLALLPEAPSPGTLIVGPETVIPVAVSLDKWREESYLRPFYDYVRRYKVNVVLGVVGYRYFPPGEPLPPSARPDERGGGYESYNAAILLRPDTAQIHIKGRLVPFVERAPYLEVLSFLRRWQIDLGGGFGHFGKPNGQPPLYLYPDSLPVGVAICYESIFAHDLRKRLPDKPTFLAILTNDGWWKKSSGYWQHLSFGRLVCQSLGVPAARSANTGVSAFISEKGELLQALPYDTMGRMQAQLSPRKPATFYYKWGEAGLWVLSTFAFTIWFVQWWRSLRS